MKFNKIFAIDFDGTVVRHKYPNIGEDVGAVPVLKRIIEHGHEIILFTMRSGKELEDAVKWFESHGIPLFGVNENPSQKVWTTSPKPFANVYIDDAALGIPLMSDLHRQERPYVDWECVERKLAALGYFNE